MHHDAMKTLVRDVAAHGVHVLPCGGGVFPDPRRALDVLEARHGRAELRALCLEFCMDPSKAGATSEAVDFAIAGMLCLMADREMLDRLAQFHAERLAEGRTLHLVEPLIASLCRRLDAPRPPGVPPLDPRDESMTFCADDPLPDGRTTPGWVLTSAGRPTHAFTMGMPYRESWSSRVTRVRCSTLAWATSNLSNGSR